MAHESLFLLILTLAAAGGFVGFMSGLLGVGGGAILVPVLYQLFTHFNVPEDVRMHLCVGTSFAVMIPTSIQSFRKHLSRNAVDVPLLKLWAWGLIGGVLLGWLVASSAPSTTLRGLFACVTLLLALKMLFGKDHWRIANEMPTRPVLDLWGLGVGLLSSLLGLGGGVFGTTILTLHNKPIHQAIATSSGIGVIVAIPGFIGYMLIGMDHMATLPAFSFGYVNFLAAILILPFSVLAAPIGVKLAHNLPKKRLEQAFALLLIIVSMRFFSTLV